MCQHGGSTIKHEKREMGREGGGAYAERKGKEAVKGVKERTRKRVCLRPSTHLMKYSLRSSAVTLGTYFNFLFWESHTCLVWSR